MCEIKKKLNQWGKGGRDCRMYGENTQEERREIYTEPTGE